MQTFAQQKQKYNKISKQPNAGEEHEQTIAKSSVFSSIWLKNRLLSQIFSLNLQHNKQLKNISYGANSRQKDRNHTTLHIGRIRWESHVKILGMV